MAAREFGGIDLHTAIRPHTHTTMFLTIQPQPKLGTSAIFLALLVGIGLLVSGVPAFAGVDDGPPPPPPKDRPGASAAVPAAPGNSEAAPATKTSRMAPATGSGPTKPASAVTPDDIPAAIDEGAAAVPAIVGRLRSGEITPEEAWKDGEITDQDILNILGADAGGAYAEAGTLAGDLDPDLAGILVEHYPERVKDPSKLKPSVRLWLGDYYRMRQDPRAVEILWALFEEGKPHRTKDGLSTPRAYYTPFAARSLGEYYEAAGNYKRAADAFLQMLPYSGGAALQANATVAAARMYARLGDEKTAQDLYQRALQYGDDWCTGLVYADEAVDLMAQHRLDEAKAILGRPTKGAIRIEILTLLGDCCYRSGDFQGAEKHCGDAIALSKSIPLPPPQEGMDQAINTAQHCLYDSQLWTRGPFTCETTPLTIALRRPGRPATRRIQVRAFRPVNLVACARSHVLRLSVAGPWVSCEDVSSNQLLVDVDPAWARGSTDDVISVTSPESPGFQLDIPIHLEITPEIAVSPSSLFLGFVRAGKELPGRLSLSSSRPFQIIKVECDGTGMQAAAEHGLRLASEHVLSYTFKAKPGKTWIEGWIRVTTDCADQSDIRVPYYACLQ